MAGTLTQTSSNTGGTFGNFIGRVVLAWTTTSGGAFSVVTSPINGTIGKVQFVPNTDAAQPTNSYGVTLTDAAGIDVLAGRGTGLSSSTATAICPGVSFTDGTTTSVVPCMTEGVLTLAVTSAGNSKSGQVILFIR